MFGVDAFGRVYAAGGKIGGWTITESNLNNGNITISSTGSINCVVSNPEVETILPKPKAETIYIVAKNYCMISGGQEPTYDYALVIPSGGPTEEAVRARLESAGIYCVKTAIEGTNNFNLYWKTTSPATAMATGGVTYRFDYSRRSGTLYVSNTSTLWKITSTGEAVFNNIQANGGTIAGWHITPDSIYLTDEEGNIRTSLNSGWDATYNVNRYTIVTNSISAGGGSIGGWSFGNNSMQVGGATLTGGASGLLISGTLGVTGSVSVGNGGAIYLDTDGDIRGTTLQLGTVSINATDLQNIKNLLTHRHKYYYYNTDT
jgi:hypothetical protein